MEIGAFSQIDGDSQYHFIKHRLGCMWHMEIIPASARFAFPFDLVGTARVCGGRAWAALSRLVCVLEEAWSS